MEKLLEYIDPTTFIGYVLTSIIVWYITKRNFQKAETDSTKADVILKNMKIYQIMLDDLEKRNKAIIAERDLEIKKLKTAFKILKEECKDYIHDKKDFK